MTPEIKRKIRKKQRLYNKQKKIGNAEDKRKFRELRSIVKRELDIAHNQYVLNLLDTREPASEEDSGKATIGKKFWNYIKSMKREHISIASLKDVTTGEEVSHAEGKAQLLSNQFESVFTNENSDASSMEKVIFHAPNEIKEYYYFSPKTYTDENNCLIPNKLSGAYSEFKSFIKQNKIPEYAEEYKREY